MCGIAGFSGLSNRQCLESMTNTLIHRGPDSSGYYENNDINLGHRRLSIIDLKTGDQPIFNEDKSILTVFNGEIYNYIELRNELIAKGHKFKTDSDTEVIVHSYEEYGDGFLNKFNGEFAIALWDDNQTKLILARDRLGIKPLYYTEINGQIIFASEIKAILIHPHVKTELNPQAIDSYLRQRYVPDSISFFNNIKKLSAGNMLFFTNKKTTLKKYWDIEIGDSYTGSDKDWVEEFYQLLSDSVKLRLRSDVEVGVYLSGGLDSSIITALAAKIDLGLKTFCIGFGSDLDEFNKAKKISQSVNGDFFGSVIQPKDFDLLPKILSYMDEPIGDAIIIPTFLLSEFASKKVKVVLSGEGADEILGGYVHHFALKYGKEFSKKLTPILFKIISKSAISFLPNSVVDNLFPYPAALGRKGKERLLDYIGTIESETASYLKLSSLFQENERRQLYKSDFYNALKDEHISNQLEAELTNPTQYSFFNRLIRYDVKHWLPENQLNRIDKLSMANSVEARVPFLDHRLVEFCFRIPENLKISFFKNKILLREIAGKILPREVSLQKKQAFYTPLDKIFKGNFKKYASDIIFCKNNFVSNIFSFEKLSKLFQNYEDSSILASKQAMAILILELWGSHFSKKGGNF